MDFHSLSPIFILFVRIFNGMILFHWANPFFAIE